MYETLFDINIDRFFFPNFEIRQEIKEFACSKADRSGTSDSQVSISGMVMIIVDYS